MSGKRALVVDDSRSARAFLSRLLEEHQLEVDSAGTAEQAIEYLTRHRPDVIFMDHLMPGMDGFQAVQAIKGNPRTATIPILMYTSQEGELYLGQARALGAIGVLPKGVERADVSKVLEQLHLTGGRAAAPAANAASPVDEEEPPDLEAAAAAAEAAASAHSANATTLAASLAAIPEPAPLAITEDVLMGLRADFERGLDERLERLLPQLRSIVHDEMPAPAPEPRHSGGLPWALAVLGLAAAAVFALLWVQQRQQLAGLTAQLREAAAGVASLPAPASAPATGAVGIPAFASVIASPGMDGAPPVPGSAPLPSGGSATPSAPPGSSGVETAFVPFGQTPLDVVRTERLRDLVGRLAAAGFAGTLDVVHHEGRFCLAGSPDSGGYALGGGSLSYERCDRVADAGDPAIGGGPRESLGFANALAELRKAHAGTIRIEVSSVAASTPDRPYPQVDGAPLRMPTAAEWNAAGLANNRVDFRWAADP